MNKIIEKVSSNGFIKQSVRNKIYAGVATIEGSIWIVHYNRLIFKRPIISRDHSTQIHQPIQALNQLERGPTGHHDIYLVSGLTVVELLYCHQSVCKIADNGVVSLCGRTYVMYTDMDCDADSDDSGKDESLEYELKNGEHLSVTSGTVKVKVSASGHRIFVGKNNINSTAINGQPTKYKITN